MASFLTRPVVLLNIAAFLAVSIFCISTQAPIIQQDILTRCQEALSIRRIPIRGLSVDGRDVILSGVPGSAIVSARARAAVEEIAGVRVIRVRVISDIEQPPIASHSATGPSSSDLPPSLDSSAPASTAASPLQHEVQEKIDRLLENQAIAFKNDTALLTPESQQALDKIAALLAAAPGLQCEVRGYDTQTSETHENWVLAFQRALATEDYLETKGVSDWRLSTRAFHVGEATEGRHGDRQVDVVVRTRE